MGLAICLLILPPPVQAAVCAAAGAAKPAPRSPTAATAITSPLRIDTHTLRNFMNEGSPCPDVSDSRTLLRAQQPQFCQVRHHRVLVDRLERLDGLCLIARAQIGDTQQDAGLVWILDAALAHAALQ